MSKYVKIFLIILLQFVLISRSEAASSPAMIDYTAYPPFVSEYITPNTLIMLDNSGSMKVPMYQQSGVSWHSEVHNNFDQTRSYYGIFDSAKNYIYDATIPVDTSAYSVTIDPNVQGAFVESSVCTPAAGNTTCWSGNFLNWLATRRIDATRMVLVGGKLESRTSYAYGSSGYYKILGNNERSDRTIMKKYASSDAYSPVPDDDVIKIMSPADNGAVLSEYDPYAKITLAGGGGQSGFINDSTGTIIGEFGKVSRNHNWTTVTLLRTLTNPVVVAKPLSYNGAAPALIRIKNVTTNSFMIKVQEWNYSLDSNHATENIFYMVVENGHHSLDNGLEIEAGTNTTNDVYAVGCSINQTQSTSASFQSNFSSTPLVIHSVSTYNGTDAVNSRVWNVSTTGFTFAMQEEENGGVHNSTETVSYIAITPGSIDNAVFTLEAKSLSDFDHNWKTINFTSSFSTAPAFLTAMQTKNADNTAVLRYKNLGTSSAGVKVEEEESCDTETNHGLEDIGYIALSGKVNSFNIALVVNNEPTGLLHDITDDVRLGISFYPFDSAVNDIYNGSKIDGGTLKFNIPLNPFVKKPSTNGGYRQLVGYIGTSLDDIVDAIEHYPLVWGTTPIAENLWEIIQYFEQDTPYYDSGNFELADDPADPDPARDPYYFTASAENLGCCQSNIIIFTDGFPYKDANIPSTIVDYDVDVNGNDCYSTLPDAQCKDNLDDVAYWAYWDTTTNDYRDLRTGTKNLNGNQYLRIYTVGFADGTIRPVLQDAADNGGGEAYAAEDGVALKAALLQAFSSILGKASSGTSASIVSNSGAGDSAVFQSYFKSSVRENLEDRKWLGYIHALFIDKNGNLREDNGNYGVLDSGDNIIKMGYSSGTGTEIYKCTYGNESLNQYTCSTTPDPDGLDSIRPIWDGGKLLWQTDPANRTIYTTTDGYTRILFEAGTTPDPDNSSVLQPYLRAADYDSDQEAKNIINWIRGDDLTSTTDAGHPAGYRKRDLTIDINGTDVTDIWKLGDIIYSTPSAVGRPMENYDLLYGDSSYTAFRSNNLKRRQVVYAGANDGMLHAFNAGFFDVAGLEYCADLDASGDCTSAGSHSLGQELWAFIPRGLLPHLKWLTDPDYTHVYYVDLKPKITDVQIFDTNTHDNGWGTILIGGFRYGGKNITCPTPCNSTSPEYFALDITDPLDPKLLWTFSNSALGLSMTYPSVAKIGTEWFVIFGSGATDYDANSNLTGFQSGNIFVLKISGGNDGEITTWGLGTNFWKKSSANSYTFMADSITVDVDIDYNVDVIYFGENYTDASNGTNWNTLLRRITTSNGSQSTPSDWTLSTVGNINAIGTATGGTDVVKRITASPSAAMDSSANLWVFFGTGEFLGTLDKNQTDTGAFYAIKDGCWAGGTGCSTTSYTNLMDMSGAIVNISNGSVGGITACSGTDPSTWSSLLSASINCDGWVMYFGSLAESKDFTDEDLLHSGERVFTKPLVLGGLVTWATYIPESDECSYDGDSNIYAVYYKTGSAYQNYVFQGQKDAADVVAAGGTTTLVTKTVARVKKLGKGMPSSLSAQITSSGKIKGFAQQSTGIILEIENITPISLKSAVSGWKSEQIP